MLSNKNIRSLDRYHPYGDTLIFIGNMLKIQTEADYKPIHILQRFLSLNVSAESRQLFADREYSIT